MQVTQKNLYILIPPTAAKITTMLRSDRNMASQRYDASGNRSRTATLRLHDHRPEPFPLPENFRN